MAVDLLELIKEFYTYHGFHCKCLYNIAEEVEELDLGFRKRMTAAFDYTRVGAALLQNLPEETAFLLEDELGMFYTFFRFKPELAEELHCRIFAIGPFLYAAVDSMHFHSLMDEKGISRDCQEDFLEFFNSLPVITTKDHWCHTLSFYFSKLCGKQISVQEVKRDSIEWKDYAPPFTDYSSPAQPNVALNTIADRYEAEQKLMNAVAAGNLELAEKLGYEFLSFRITPRNPSPLRDKKNLMITFNTLMRKAAQVGGVHPLHIDHLSRQFAIQIESSLSLKQLDGIHSTMIHKYCLMVQNYSRRRYCATVQACLDIIDFYYNSELSLSYLAQTCSVSENHLSAIFKKETGMTVTDCINETRIRQSIILLNATQLSISEIASRCGFSDANYFARMFKKRQGKTPREYRNYIRGTLEK